MIKKAGIDVSAHQGAINWAKVKQDFAILRAGWSWYEGGMNIDQRFRENVTGTQAAGIPWGVYLYAYDKTPTAAVKSADRLADLLDKYQIPYPVAYDFEDGQYVAGDRRETNTAICAAFLKRLQERGYYAILYTYTNFARSYIDMALLAAYDLWIADYTGKVGWTGPYGMWQHSAKGRLEAIGGGKVDVDLNIAYKDYPAIIRGAGLNGYRERPNSEEDYAALRREVEALGREKAALETEKAALAAKIFAARAALR